MARNAADMSMAVADATEASSSAVADEWEDGEVQQEEQSKKKQIPILKREKENREAAQCEQLSASVGFTPAPTAAPADAKPIPVAPRKLLRRPASGPNMVSAAAAADTPAPAATPAAPSDVSPTVEPRVENGEWTPEPEDCAQPPAPITPSKGEAELYVRRPWRVGKELFHVGEGYDDGAHLRFLDLYTTVDYYKNTIELNEICDGRLQPRTGRSAVQHTNSAIQGLEALREEHAAIHTGLNANVGAEEAQLVAEKKSIVETNMDKISHAIEDAQVMLSIVDNVDQNDAETEQLKWDVARLEEEHAWLHDELSSAQNKQQQSEQRVAQLEEEHERLKQYDNDQNGAAAPAAKQEDVLPAKSHEDTLLELGFGPEHDEAMGGSYAHPTPAASANGGYEVPARLRTLHNLVSQYASQGRYEVAVPLCKQALEDLERNSGHDHPDVATMLNILALVYRDQNKYKEAANLLNEALAIREKCLGENHPPVAATLNNLAVLYTCCGKCEEAEPLCECALEIREKVLGRDQPDVAKQLNNLALEQVPSSGGGGGGAVLGEQKDDLMTKSTCATTSTSQSGIKNRLLRLFGWKRQPGGQQ